MPISRAGLLAALFLSLTACEEPKLDDTAAPGVPDVDGDGYVGDVDCDDTDPAIHPGASELCDGVDNDCDGLVDDDDDQVEGAPLWYGDGDGDGYGGTDDTLRACSQPSGYQAEADDCDDGSPDVHPGAEERCNLTDDDCDGRVDGDDDDVVGLPTWYIDRDEDGWGDDGVTTSSCDQPSGFVSEGGDCDDADPDYHPRAPEDDCTDPNDYDCDGSVAYTDEDADGWADCVDCNDRDAAINPDADEVCDRVDNDCDGDTDEDDAIDAPTWYADTDADGYGDPTSPQAACYQSSGFVADDTDCDDSAADVNPGATELCDGVDNDCDGTTDASASDAPTWYADSDDDGFGDPTVSADACTQPSGYVSDESDCDDSDSAVNPGATETCNGVDDDCNGDVDDGATDVVSWYADDDDDGFGDAGSSTTTCSPPSGYLLDDSDCDDTDDAIYPGATEHCDGVDEDCDGTVDDGAVDAGSWFADADGDGFGDAADTTQACSAPSDFVADDTDCDDTDDSIFPGADEHCDGVDEDCDGTVDDGATDVVTWYADDDTDGYGDPSVTAEACSAPDDFVADATDCDDTDGDVHPGADEHCDGADEDCDGNVDEGAVDASTWYADDDADGYGDPTITTQACSAPDDFVADASDCDDTDDAIHPGADEHCDGVDEDCDGAADDAPVDGDTWYADDDGDGYGDPANSTQACTIPDDFVADDSDCDDTNGTIFPGADEHCDGVDEDCDGAIDDGATDLRDWYADADADGYGDLSDSTFTCTPPSGRVADDTDCDDTDGDVHPGADEHCDGQDEDCDGSVDEGAVDAGTWYADADTDGYGDPADSTIACTQPSGTVTDDSDCDDTDGGIYPGADEHCDGVDEDCDGTTDEDAVDITTWYDDADGDGYGDATAATVACTQPSETVTDATDCDDSDAGIYPGADEHCDGQDTDCDGVVDPTGYITELGGGDYDDLGVAVASAAAGATLNICPGTYSENLVLDQELTLVGVAGASSTTVTAESAGSVIMISGGPVTLQGLTITGGTGTWDPVMSATTGGGILVTTTDRVTLLDCVLTGNDVADVGGGLYACPSADLSMEDCEVSANTAGSDGGGVYLDLGAYLAASDTLFSANESSSGAGLALSYASADLVSCEVESNLGDEGAGLHITGDSSSLITLYGSSVHSNLAADSGGGLFVASTPTVQGGWVYDNESLGDGGGVTAVDASTGTTTGAYIEDLDIEDNLASFGGGLWIYQRTNLLGVSITGNMALDVGGGLYAEYTTGNTDMVVSIENGEVNTNMAGSGGGGAYLRSAPMESTGTTWGTGADDNDPDDVSLDQGSGVAAAYSSFDDSGADFTCDFTTMVCAP